MAGRVQEQRLGSREARAKVQPSKNPVYRELVDGAHIGYRRGKKGTGVWTLRRYADGKYQVSTIGNADDLVDADGVNIFTWHQAVERARDLVAAADATPETAAKGKGPITIGQILTAYIEHAKVHQRSPETTVTAIEALIRPTFDNVLAVDLTVEKLEAWRDAMAAQPARLRMKAGAVRKPVKVKMTEEQTRKRRATTNRLFNVLRAALSFGFRRGMIADDRPWKRAQNFKLVDVPRDRWLNVAEVGRLLNAAAPDLRNLIRAACETGARHAELAGLKVSDWNPDTNKIFIRKSKGGKARFVDVTEDGAKFFHGLTLGRAADATLLTTASGATWTKNRHARPFKEAAKVAKLGEGVSFHSLRHSYASICVQNGMSLLILSKVLGHSTTRMTEKTYAHLAEKHVAETVRAHAPRFGIVDEPSNVVALR